MSTGNSISLTGSAIGGASPALTPDGMATLSKKGRAREMKAALALTINQLESLALTLEAYVREADSGGFLSNERMQVEDIVCDVVRFRARAQRVIESTNASTRGD